MLGRDCSYIIPLFYYSIIPLLSNRFRFQISSFVCDSPLLGGELAPGGPQGGESIWTVKPPV